MHECRSGRAMKDCRSHPSCTLLSLCVFPPHPPPSFPPLPDLRSLSLPPSLSDALLTKSRLLRSKLRCDLFLTLISTLPTGWWTERRGGEGRTRAPIQSLAGAGDESSLLPDRGDVRPSCVAGPHCDLNNFCSARWELICLLFCRFFSWELFPQSSVCGFDRSCNKYIPNSERQ